MDAQKSFVLQEKTAKPLECNDWNFETNFEAVENLHRTLLSRYLIAFNYPKHKGDPKNL